MSWKDWLVIVLLCEQAMLGYIAANDPATLGLSKIVAAWLGVINIGVAVLLNQLQRLGVNPPPAPPPPEQE